jgi:tetratricopeptide (TPR) repeat protein
MPAKIRGRAKAAKVAKKNQFCLRVLRATIFLSAVFRRGVYHAPRMKQLEPPDTHHLDAAIGWLGLGCADDARDELKLISAGQQNHPDVLEMWWTLCVHEKDWPDALQIAELELKFAPDDAGGWLHRAYALRRVNGGGLPKAWDALLPAAGQFPQEPVIAYNLSCYACQMQQLDLAREWLQRAVQAGKKEVIKQMALADDDLQPLWTEIKEL